LQMDDETAGKRHWLPIRGVFRRPLSRRTERNVVLPGLGRKSKISVHRWVILAVIPHKIIRKRTTHNKRSVLQVPADPFAWKVNRGRERADLVSQDTIQDLGRDLLKAHRNNTLDEISRLNTPPLDLRRAASKERQQPARDRSFPARPQHCSRLPRWSDVSFYA